jgi:hypothetical protein
MERMASEGRQHFEASVLALRMAQDRIAQLNMRVQSTQDATVLCAARIRHMSSALAEQDVQVGSLSEAFSAFSDSVSHLRIMSTIGGFTGFTADEMTSSAPRSPSSPLSLPLSSRTPSFSSSRSFSSSPNSLRQAHDDTPSNETTTRAPANRPNLHRTMISEATAMNHELYQQLLARVAVMNVAISEQLGELGRTIEDFNETSVRVVPPLRGRSGVDAKATAACANLLHFFTTLRARGLVSQEQHGTLKQLLIDATSRPRMP